MNTIYPYFYLPEGGRGKLVVPTKIVGTTPRLLPVHFDFDNGIIAFKLLPELPGYKPSRRLEDGFTPLKKSFVCHYHVAAYYYENFLKVTENYAPSMTRKMKVKNKKEYRDYKYWSFTVTVSPVALTLKVMR